MIHRIHLLATLVLWGLASAAHAQSSSLYRQDVPLSNQAEPLNSQAAPVRLQQGSWTYTPPPPVVEVKLNDLVYVRVNIGSEVLSEGDSEVRKSGLYNAVLADWIRLDGLRWVKPAPQSDGSPTINGQLTQRRRAESYVETRDSLEFDIQARVVDIRPNGNLILEARKNINNNEEHWEYSLTGECRAQDIGPGNTILSRNIADLRIDKRERGQVRDGYKRGWFQKWFDQVIDPF
jgi:flagellar L-ring protein precursor FlgH